MARTGVNWDLVEGDGLGPVHDPMWQDADDALLAAGFSNFLQPGRNRGKVHENRQGDDGDEQEGLPGDVIYRVKTPGTDSTPRIAPLFIQNAIGPNPVGNIGNAYPAWRFKGVAGAAMLASQRHLGQSSGTWFFLINCESPDSEECIEGSSKVNEGVRFSLRRRSNGALNLDNKLSGGSSLQTAPNLILGSTWIVAVFSFDAATNTAWLGANKALETTGIITGGFTQPAGAQIGEVAETLPFSGLYGARFVHPEHFGDLGQTGLDRCIDAIAATYALALA
ncbi:MAG: hypothetical protein ABNH53_01310 [Henriciella sp.]|jgi:hypothetical protein